MFFSTHWVCAVVKLLESPQCTLSLQKTVFWAQDGVFPPRAGAGSIVVILTVEDLFSALLHFQKLCLLETTMGFFPPANPTQGHFCRPTHIPSSFRSETGARPGKYPSRHPCPEEKTVQLINSVPLKRIFNKLNLSKPHLAVNI